ncbi:Inositolphosphorylceramide-B hydroxylase [Violaceomyces palustris]|uniref:Inositolphosphorylceramide-B hydroxylase n=1 Tax=Violaceomyces palustris TaxID=1673888 RepID=A0ACD0NZI6_9BASI|nr:Inositolphosphorylceramide-B hydroxylase [Violaceomyces palustris]
MAQSNQATVKVFSDSEVSKHSTLEDCWVIHRGKVYNVTDFVMDHPGGEDLIGRYAGKDMGEIMDDPIEHSHSDSAYEVLEEYLIGRLVDDAEPSSEAGDIYNGKDSSIVITDDFKPSETDGSNDYQKHKFLDLTKPLILQVWNANFSKEFYLEQVHSPRHLKEPARLFGPDYLEVFTRTPWYVVPMVWVPIAAAIFYRSTSQFIEAAAASTSSTSPVDPSAASVAFAQTFLCFLLGNFIWTIIEYGMHRCLFHIDDLLPDKPFFLMLHFLLHGVHHYLPMDRLRLVMPPVLFAALSYPFTQLAYALFPVAVANGIISGAFAMYVCYDCMHYALHHTKLPTYLRKMKKYHLEHHYKNFELGFGVTSKFWDYVFGTML